MQLSGPVPMIERVWVTVTQVYSQWATQPNTIQSKLVYDNSGVSGSGCHSQANPSFQRVLRGWYAYRILEAALVQKKQTTACSTPRKQQTLRISDLVFRFVWKPCGCTATQNKRETFRIPPFQCEKKTPATCPTARDLNCLIISEADSLGTFC